MYLLCFFTLISCGKGYVDKDPPQEEVTSGHYWAVLNPLNPKLGQFKGWISLSINDNQFWARIKVSGPGSKEMHNQFLHVKGTCPEMKDDLNHDGYLDFMEAYKVAGPILIPLDSNLNSQMKGMYEFPRMRGTSNFYYYSEACNMDNMMADLRRKDVYVDDMMAKIPRHEKFNFTKRVVLIYGTSEDRNLPATVRTYQGYPSQASIPIACGVIEEGYSDAFDL